MGMKLFLIIYSAGQIGGVAGPLPYDMKECEYRRDEFRSKQQELFDTKFSKALNRPATEEEIEKTKDMKFECEYRETRPKLGDPL